MRTSTEIKSFYNDFSKRVLMRDFRYLNLRHDAIRNLCRKFIPRGAKVLEIGCGVGIIAKYLQSVASRVLSVDISETNVAVAREYAASSNCEVRVLDVIEEGEKLAEYGRFDAVLLPDVIEHIPKAKYPQLFSTIEGAMLPGGRVLLTYPSPEVQAHIAANSPDIMQVVDENIELSEITEATSLKPVYFAYRDIWGRNEYVHLVLTNDRSYLDGVGKESLGEKIAYRIRKYRWRFSNYFFLRRINRKLTTIDTGSRDG
jgi:SAM-dependent methyltransferase